MDTHKFILERSMRHWVSGLLHYIELIRELDLGDIEDVMRLYELAKAVEIRGQVIALKSIELQEEMIHSSTEFVVVKKTKKEKKNADKTRNV